MSLLSIVRGDRKVFSIALTDSDGDPIDLDLLTLTFTAKENVLDLVPLLEKVSGDGIEHAANQSTTGKGLATLTIDPADTADLTALRTDGEWDVQIDDGAGDVRTVLSGRIVITADITTPVAS